MSREFFDLINFLTFSCSGAFSNVYKALDLKTGQKVAGALPPSLLH